MTAFGAFLKQRQSAKWRGIDFRLTFAEWLSIWEASGHLSERGRRRGQYVMARFGDRGPYAVGNVKIITQVQNSQEKRLGAESRAKIAAAQRASNRDRTHSASTKAKMSAAHRGKLLSAETRAKIGEANRGKRPWLGRRHSPEARAKISSAKIGKSISPEHAARLHAGRRRAAAERRAKP